MKILMTLMIIVLQLNQLTDCRKHRLVLTNDERRYITISTFGYFIGGHLSIEVNKFSDRPHNDNSIFGFTLAKTMSDSLTPYLEGHEDRCLLKDDVVTINNDENIGLVSMIFDFKKNRVVLKCNKLLSKLRFSDGFGLRHKRENKSIVSNKFEINNNNNENNKENNNLIYYNKIIGNNANDINVINNFDYKPIDTKIDEKDDYKSVAIDDNNDEDIEDKSCSIPYVKLIRSGDPNHAEYSFKIQAVIAEDSQEGLYSLLFHNCPNYGPNRGSVNLNMTINEDNLGNYLSAGEIPLPGLYFALSVIFLLLGIVMIDVIRNKHNYAFKLHYLMAGFVFVKALCLMFDGINNYYISIEGSKVETWAVLYYVTHLMNGILLYIIIVLIGTGGSFDKKILMIVIPLQVLANIADIITEEIEKGELKYNMWREIFILVDLLCSGVVLFPIFWSIRHLQKASKTVGNSAINLRKLKLLRHFFIMIVSYIYFTRIVVYLLKITIPFSYEWLIIFFQYLVSLVFFILTGYYFQPTSTINPYFQLDQSNDYLNYKLIQS
ncbi:protein GPR107-like [Oppia nitens]|uniref:protein GPR107-like n=1 Tax=Oppia nitens TaxID=1686743 RepID=UPI0023D9B01F|nr:protein GPR107-like [Oppia nitens]